VVEEEDVDWGGRKVAALGMVRRARGATSAAGVAVGRAHIDQFPIQTYHAKT
jgi:hypothetical protein